MYELPRVLCRIMEDDVVSGAESEKNEENGSCSPVHELGQLDRFLFPTWFSFFSIDLGV